MNGYELYTHSFTLNELLEILSVPHACISL